jgi:trans-aconitate methyltransferase
VQKDMIEKVRQFWETCGLKYAHITDANAPSPGSTAEYFLKRGLIDKIEWQGKTVIDYGCGGGHIGKYLFDKCEIAEYHAVDIALRSLESAMYTLDGRPCTFHQTPVDLKTIKADILFSMACIQHFPNREHLDEFLENVNESEIKTVALQIRNHRSTRFNNAYIEGGDYGYACRTNAEYLAGRLSNYNLISDYLHELSGYKYLIYEAK